jgi:hypothetical protein
MFYRPEFDCLSRTGYERAHRDKEAALGEKEGGLSVVKLSERFARNIGG